MKLLTFSAFTASLLFLMSLNGEAINTDSKPLAPNFSIENNYGSCSTNKNKGKYLLLQFWNSTDAESRVKNIESSKLIASSKSINNIEYAGVYTGYDKTLYDASLTNDGVDVRHQYYLGDEKNAANIFADFSLSSGNHTFLISPDGRIITVNPSSDEILTLTNN